MTNTVYDFLGFRLTSIDLKCNMPLNIQKLKIGIRNYKYSADNNIVTIYPYVEICGDKITNVFEYNCGFKINDKNLINNFKDESNNDNIISILFATVYPFIRENISSITRDTIDTVILPTIDCRNISLKNAIILTPSNPKLK